MGVGIILLGIAFAYLSKFVNVGNSTSIESRIEAYISANTNEFTQLESPQEDMTGMVLSVLEDSFKSGELDAEGLILKIPYLHFWIHSNHLSQFESLFSQYLTSNDVEILLLYINAQGHNPEKAISTLEEFAKSTPPRRFANQILGTIADSELLINKAYSLYRKEGEFPEAQWAREQAVGNRYYKKDFKALAALESDPRYNDAFRPWIRAEIASHNRDWASALKWIALGQFSGIETGSFILATLGMGIWAMILLQLCQVSRLDKLTPLLCFIGLLLGVLSTTPTLFWIIIEEAYLPISEGDNLLHSIVYYVATVGLREEVCKFLMFLPLAPFLIKRGNEIECLLVASFVGLGFAYEENFSYLSDSMGMAITGRFLTANFVHISLTGMSGLFFCRAWVNREYSYNDFLYIFGLAIATHGLYDALLTHPPMDDGGMFAMILYILFSKFYFNETHKLRERTESLISMTATMVFGISLLIASLLVYLSTSLDLGVAIKIAFSSFLGSAIILFMFFREFDEKLTQN